VDESPVAVRWYIAGLTFASAVAVGLCLAVGSGPSVRSRPVLAAALAAAALIAQFFPIHLADKTKVHVDAAALTAVVFLVSPIAAACLAAAAVATHHAVRRDDWEQTVFNVAQTALYVGAGALVFRALGATGLPPEIPGLGSWVGVLAAVAAMHLLNTLAVAGIAALQLGHSPVQVWREEFWLDFPEFLALVVLGVVLASLASDRPWLLALAVPPVALVYSSLRRGAEIRAAAESASAATGDLLDLLTQAPRGHSRRVADWTCLLAGRIGLSTAETSAAVRAAHLHGLALLTGRQKSGGVRSRDPRPFRGRDDRDIDASARTQSRNAILARHVSERWDGSGGPDALAGEAIPVAARLVAVADAFDQLVEARTLGGSLAAGQALRILRDGAGLAWDPRVVAALGKIVDDSAA
jgi:HD-GYP domain-containing protein (c-di-GMP phosphodiesterase class II)